MTIYDVREISPQEQTALDDFERLIHARYPDATFDVSVGGEPDGVYLTVTVDLEDSGEVIDHILDRLLEVHIDEGLPVYVVTARPVQSPAAARPKAPSTVFESPAPRAGPSN
ncbi:MAG: hypothetical protein H0V24_08700 [Chloroflexia bacterium]|nr:hypothetical protein [Chloroflexia bacterium]MDQ3410952.1 hypothetical protein [Chloroflexota bacterium]